MNYFVSLQHEYENSVEIPVATGQHATEFAVGLRGVFYCAHGVFG
jgi:hypothetical protein